MIDKIVNHVFEFAVLVIAVVSIVGGLWQWLREVFSNESQ